MFGAITTPGAQALGAAATPGAAAATPAAGGLFGAPAAAPTAAAAPTFGAAALAPTFGGGLAGAKPAAAPATGGGLFGATPAAAPAGGGLFGASPSAAPATGGGLFGATPASATAGGGGLFGATPSLASTGAAGGLLGGLSPALAAPAAPQAAQRSQAEQDLDRLRAAFTVGEGNPEYRFRHFFVDLLEGPQGRVKPAGVDNLRWQEALEEAGSVEGLEGSLWPHPVGYQRPGFAELQDRLKKQEECLAGYTQFLLDCRERIMLIQQSHEAQVLARLEACRKTHEKQRQQLLALMRRIDFLEGRPFRRPMTQAEEQLGASLRALVLELQQGTASLPGRIEAVAATARMHYPVRRIPEGEMALDGHGVAETNKVLSDCAAALQELERTLTKDRRDVGIIVKHRAEGQ